MKVTAVAERSGDWWAVSVPEVEGVFTQARRLEQVPAMVADAVALMLDLEEPVEVEVQPHTREDELVRRARQARAEFERASRESSAAARAAARALVDDGLTVRDAGELLDLSPQRVSQLVNA